MSEAEFGWSDFSETEADEWASIGVGERDAAAWRALGVDVVVAGRWTIAGFGPAEAGQWEGVIRPSHRYAVDRVTRWRDAGFSSTEAEVWCQHGLQPEEAALERAAGRAAREAAEAKAVRMEAAAAEKAELDAAQARRLAVQHEADEEARKQNAARARVAAAERAALVAEERAAAEQRMREAVEKAAINEDLIFIEWSPPDGTQTREFTIDELSQFRSQAATNEWHIQSVITSSSDVVILLDVLTGYAVLDLLDVDDFELNGVELEIASSPSGWMLVPRSSVLGHELVEIAYSDASWLPGGPVVFEQSEGIYRLGDMYWSRAAGDVELACAYAGSFPTESEGVAAAAQVSTYFSVVEDGTIRCELDDWPNDE